MPNELESCSHIWEFLVSPALEPKVFCKFCLEVRALESPPVPVSITFANAALQNDFDDIVEKLDFLERNYAKLEKDYNDLYEAHELLLRKHQTKAPAPF